ncbi:Kelch repeat-containing protein [Planctobacterium marinum]|uniref:Ring canal kelch-like protein n=1 Tax=Planctobacterium marinum TaxID=1631968 RepID=A0AA48HS53_9ALTE|nr:hypothetical protein MACH26_03640 [Planctobacterium marinum]
MRISTAVSFLCVNRLLLFLIIFFPQMAVSAEKDNAVKWQHAASLPYRVQEIYPLIFQGHIIVAGGLSPDVDQNGIDVSDRVVAYSLEDKTWFDMPTLPQPRHHPMLTVVNDRLLSFGGFIMDEQGMWHNSRDVLEWMPGEINNEKSSLLQGHWQKIASLPAPLSETLAVVNEGQVHLVSGRTPAKPEQNSQWNHQKDVATHYVFDPNNLQFEQKAAVPTARNSACSVKLNGYWHTIAGRTVSGGNLASHEVYDFVKDIWIAKAPLPDAQGGLACAVIEQHIYVFGGEYFDNGGGVYSTVWQYTNATDSWRAVSEMPLPRHGLGAISHKNRIYIIGGALQAGGVQTSDAMTVFSLQH